jgi:hypothetical protein
LKRPGQARRPGRADPFTQALTASERKQLTGLSTPFKIQAFLDGVPYSGEECYRCPLTFVRHHTGHCFDGAVFAALMLSRLGHSPRIVDLLPNERDDDHILAVYQRGGHWGAVAKSNFAGLRFREPVYRSLRELVMSYFADYYNSAGEKTMRAYTVPLDLQAFDRDDWTTKDEAMDRIAERLGRIRKHTLLSPAMVENLSPMDRRAFEAGMLGVNPSGLYKTSGWRPSFHRRLYESTEKT